MLLLVISISAIANTSALELNSISLQSNGTISYYATNFPKLKGINMFVCDWIYWNYSEMDTQIADVAAAGFNFVRTGVFFEKFFDFNTDQINSTQNEWAYQQTVHFLNDLKANNLYVSVVPMETDELGQLQNEYWYTDSYYQSVLQSYYYNFAHWCYQMGWTNILYISVWWEASSGTPWQDGIYCLQNQLPNLVEANNDWEAYCAENNYTVAPLSLTGNGTVEKTPTLWYYDNWSRSIFDEITQIKAEAVRQGYPGMLVGGEIGFVGNPYNAWHWTPQFYLGAIENESNRVVNPSLCAESYVDVLELHDYFNNTQQEVVPYLTYPTQKIKVMAECGPDNYTTSGTGNLTAWFDIIEPKMNAFYQQANGFAYWDWKDYDSRPMGLENINCIPRPALDTISTWIKALGS